jgi:hypothetical protein
LNDGNRELWIANPGEWSWQTWAWIGFLLAVTIVARLAERKQRGRAGALLIVMLVLGVILAAIFGLVKFVQSAASV